jgi:hypothetical protein
MNIYRGTVGVAPGTTTMQLGWLNPYNDVVQLSAPITRSSVKSGVKKSLHLTGSVDTRARIRWDLIGLVGGGSLVIAMTAGLIASALR